MVSITSRRWKAVASLAALALIFITFPLAAAEQGSPDYAKQIDPIFRMHCLACHMSAAKQGGLVLEDYASVMKGGLHGPVVIPGRSGESRMIQMLEGQLKPQMPFAGAPLAASEIALIRGWIDAGAKGPAPGEAPAPAPKLEIPDIKPTVPVVSPIGAIAYSPDGKTLAVGGYQQVRLLDASSGRTMAIFGGHADLVRGLAFSPDGKLLAAAGGLPARSGEVKVWDVGTGKLARTLVGHNDCIYAVAISPDGKLLATGSYDKLIKLWDLDSGKELRTLKDHIDAVFVVSFSPDGKRLASGAQDRTVKIWDVASGERLYTMSEALDTITTVAFHPSGAQLATGGFDKLIRVYDLRERSAALSTSMLAHEDAILRLVYSPDGKRIISSSSDRTIRVWDAQTLTAVKALEKQSDWAEALSVSPDGKWLAAGRYDGTVSVYRLDDYRAALGPVAVFEGQGIGLTDVAGVGARK